jgi:hypothetical protein
MHETLEDEVQRIVNSMHNEEQNRQEQETPGNTEQEPEPAETIHIHYFPDAIVILKEENNKVQPDNAIETTLAKPRKPPVLIAYATGIFYLFLILSCIAFQFYCMFNPPIATITIVPKSQTVTLTGTLQLGRPVNPLTISQSATTITTGKGHQDAKGATGLITFYNGQFTQQTIAAGTILTGSDATQVITDQDATIPAANPPSFGQVTVSAHATIPGVRENIPGYDINVVCCATSVLAKNTNPFTGGQDERNYQTVEIADIAMVATPLKTAVARSMQGAMQGQLTPQEQLYLPPCTPIVTSDHQPGQEATHVTVTVAQTCNAVVYNSQELETKALDLLTHQAKTTVGTGFSLLGRVNVTVTQATIANTHPTPVILSFHAQGTWVYAIGNAAQEHIKRLIAGKTRPVALRELLSLPGVERVSIAWSDDTRLPKNPVYIHFHVVVQSLVS